MAASLTELGVLRGRREKEAELGEGQEEKERKAGLGWACPTLSQPQELFAVSR